MKFKLNSLYKPSIGQQKAISELTTNFRVLKKQTLLGITGSGKTFVMANLIEALQKPTLIIAHNKTLAAQLFTEFKDLFLKIGLSISFHIMTIINLNPIYQRQILTLKRFERKCRH